MAGNISNILLGASPNWYCSRVCDSNGQNMVAYGARNSIVLIDVKPRPPNYVALIPAHKDRVTSVAFCRSKRPEVLATGSEDGVIRAWDIIKRKYFYEFQSEEKIICVGWQERSDQVIFASTEQGNLFMLDLLHSDVRHLKCGIKNPVIVLASCSTQPNLLATGHKGGAVIILDVSQGHIVHKLKGHEDDILSLSWRLTHEEQLVSTSRDRTLRIWNISTEKAVNILRVPQSSPRGGKEDYKLRPWICTLCCQDGKLVTSTFSGTLILWNLDSEQKQKWEALQTKDIGGHNKCIFTICSVDPDGKKLCTISLDRQVILWDLKLKKSEYVLSTIGGFVFCLSFSPLDVGRLAIGAGDQSIRIWNASSRSSASFTTTLWQGIKGKVTAVAWHQEKEGLLAFGTEDGKVGVYDVLSSRPPTISSTFHKFTVYTVTWGPNINSHEGSDTTWCLYSCGDGVILIHDMTHPQLDALNIDNFLKKTVDKNNEKVPQRTEISWKPDFTIFGIGNDDGSVDIYSKDCKLLARLLVQNKLIQSLRWHPLYTAVSSEQSSMHMWLASASTESVVHVFDLSDVLAAEVDSPLTTVTRSTRQLVGHRCRVVSLSWNPHVEGRLASASYDGTVQVWDAGLGQPIANYRGHQGRVYCVEWSLFDSDVIFSGGEDYTVQQWKIGDQLHRLPPTKQEAAKQKKNMNGYGKMVSKQKDVNGTSQQQAGPLIEKLDLQELEGQLDEENQKQEILDEEGSTDTISGKDFDQQDINDSHEFKISQTDVFCQESAIKVKKVDLVYAAGKKSGKGGSYLECKKKKKMKSFFPVVSSFESRGKSFAQDDCRALADYFLNPIDNGYKENVRNGVIAKPDSDNYDRLGLFMHQDAALRMIKTEVNHHQEVDNIEYAYQLGVWTGNIGDVLKKAAEKEELSDWLVSLAPLASYSLWNEICKKYACQLVKEGNYHKAVLYLLGCHEIYEAIHVLKEHVSYRDALALAKIRLPPSDPLVQELLSGWAKRADRDGNYELAAKCYLAQQNPLSAAKVLIKRSDPNSSRLAAHIARMCGSTDEANVYSLSCLKESLLKNDWTVARELITEQPFIENFKVLISVHEVLTNEDKKINSDGNNFGFLGLPTIKDDFNGIIFWRKYMTEDLPFISYLLKLLHSEGHFDAERGKLIESYEAIKSLSVQSQTPHTAKEMQFHLAVDLSLAILSSFTLDKSHVLNHIFHAIWTCYNSACMSILNTLFTMLITSDLTWKSTKECQKGGVTYSNISKEAHVVSCIFHEMLITGFDAEIFLPHKLLVNDIKDEIVSQGFPVTALPKIFSWIDESLPENFDMFLLIAYFCTSLLDSIHNQVDTISANFKCLSDQASKNIKTITVLNTEDKFSCPETDLVCTLASGSSITGTDNIESVQVVNEMSSMSEDKVTVINKLVQTFHMNKDNIGDDCKIENDNFVCPPLQTDLINSCSTSEKANENGSVIKPMDAINESISIKSSPYILDESTGFAVDSRTDSRSTALTDNSEETTICDENETFLTATLEEHPNGFENCPNLTEADNYHNNLLLSDNDYCDLNIKPDAAVNVVESQSDCSSLVTKSKKSHSDCLLNAGLVLYLLQKCHTFLLCDIYALYFCLKNKLKDIEFSLASRKASERITENCQTSAVAPLTPTNIPFEGDIDLECTVAADDDTSLCVLQEEYHIVACYIKKLEEKIKGMTPPNPVSSAVKLTEVYQTLLNTCSCDEVCEVLRKYCSDAAKWALQFAITEDDVKTLNKVI